MKHSLNNFQLKFAMALLMVLDHIHYIPNLLTPELTGFFHVITRFVGAWFSYAAVEGFMHTRNKTKYNLRLFTWAIIMASGNFVLNNFTSSKNLSISNNIFLSLALGVLCLNILEKFSKSGKLNFLGFIQILVIFIFGSIFSEGGILIIPFIIITYVFYNKPKSRNISYIIMFIITFSMSFVTYEDISTTLLMLSYNSEFLFSLCIFPLLYLYNGEKGPSNNFSKYFFYIFYPLHLWIIEIIAYLDHKFLS